MGKTYLDDVVERNNVRNGFAIFWLATPLCCSIGPFTKPVWIANMIECVQNVRIDSKIVSSYIDHIENDSLFKGAARYDVKGLCYYEVNKKYYCIDFRNARLNIPQLEQVNINFTGSCDFLLRDDWQ